MTYADVNASLSDQAFCHTDVAGSPPHSLLPHATLVAAYVFLPLLTLAQVYAGSWPPLHWSESDGLLIHMHVPHRKVKDATRLDFLRFSLRFIVVLVKDQNVLLFVIAVDSKNFVTSECRGRSRARVAC